MEIKFGKKGVPAWTHKVLVEPGETQGVYREHEEIPDGVYTENIVWQEALLHGCFTCLRCSGSPRASIQIRMIPLAIPTQATEKLTDDMLKA